LKTCSCISGANPNCFVTWWQEVHACDEQSGFPKWINANNAIWLDYDRDGKLDLFIGGYYPDNVNLWKLKNTRMMPDSYEYAQNGGRKYLTA
jgi:hypothetical protein